MTKLLHDVVVGNEFVIPTRTKLRMATPTHTPVIVRPHSARVPVPALALPELHHIDLDQKGDVMFSPLARFMDFIHDHSLAVYSLLVLMTLAPSIQLGSHYYANRYSIAPKTSAAAVTPTRSLRGPNTSVELAKLDAATRAITSQAINLQFGDKSAAISPEQINNWLQVVKDKKVAYIHVDQTAIDKTVAELSKPYVKDPVNQVTATYADGSSRVIATGRDGSKVGDTSALRQQISRDLLGAKGMQINMPVETVPFAAVTPAAFDKMIEVNVVSKQMYLWQNGQVYKSYPISAGAPETPTPIGQFKTFSKLPVQDMRGFNADGSKYFQPNVKWVMYFMSGGYALHGNYWRPADWFGNINSSHGCASLPDAQAKEVYDWAPLGTTVITHA